MEESLKKIIFMYIYFAAAKNKKVYRFWFVDMLPGLLPPFSWLHSILLSAKNNLVGTSFIY